MLTLKEVNKVRTMYYEQNYTATEIARIMKISRQTIYNYLIFSFFYNFLDFIFINITRYNTFCANCSFHNF